MPACFTKPGTVPPERTITLASTDGARKSSAAATSFAAFCAVELRAANVPPIPAMPTATAAVRAGAIRPQRRRLLGGDVTRRLRLRAPDPRDLVNAEQEQRNEDEQDEAAAAAGEEREPSHLGHAVANAADHAVSGDAPALHGVVGVALRHEVDPPATPAGA